MLAGGRLLVCCWMTIPLAGASAAEPLPEDAWLAAGFPNDPAALDAIAEQTAARFARDHKL